jgi:hypothetical protein
MIVEPIPGPYAKENSEIREAFLLVQRGCKRELLNTLPTTYSAM